MAKILKQSATQQTCCAYRGRDGGKKYFRHDNFRRFTAVLAAVSVAICLSSTAIFSADITDFKKFGEKVGTFNGGTVYKVRKNNTYKDVVVYDDGRMRDIDPSERAHFLKKDRMSTELQKQFNSRPPNDTIAVTIWLTDIDDKQGFSSTDPQIDFIIGGKTSQASESSPLGMKKMLLRKGYMAKLKNFHSKSLSKTDSIIFSSSFVPFMIIKTTVKNLPYLANNKEVTALGLHTNSQKADEVAYSIPNINGNYTRDKLGLKGSGIKVGIVENGYPDMTNAQLAGRNIVFDENDSIVKRYSSAHATKVASIIAGETQGLAPDATVYVARAVNKSMAGFARLRGHKLQRRLL
jgi:hypothetical protein